MAASASRLEDAHSDLCRDILAIEITHVDDFTGQEIRIDPLRLIEATTAGVAFLAAGLIFFSKGTIQGLTTGAGMWLAGATGLAVGLGFWQIAVLITIIALIVLGALQMMQAGHRQKPAGSPDSAETPENNPESQHE